MDGLREADGNVADASLDRHETTQRDVYGQRRPWSALPPALRTMLAALVAVFAAANFTPRILDLPLGLYTPLHSVMEIFAVVVAGFVFTVGWNADRHANPARSQMIACAFLAVALLDVGHLLSVKGMPDFVTPSSPEKGIAFWLPGRLADAVALLLAATNAWHARSQLNRWVLLAASLVFTALVYIVVLGWPEVLPRTFIPGSGLTPFKIGAEYTIVAVHVLTLFLLTRMLGRDNEFDAAGLFTATAVMALSELFFTLYGTPHDVYLVLGHVYKVIAYGLVYRMVFIDAVRRPSIELHRAEDRERYAIRAALQASEEYTVMLQRAAQAAQAITAKPTIEDTINQVAEQARLVIGANMALVSLTRGNDWSKAITASSLADKYARWRDYDAQPDGSGIYGLVIETGRPLRLTQAQLKAHPRWRGFGRHAATHPPVNGLLAVPMVSRTGTNIGVLQLSDKELGDFTERDEYVTMELAQLAAIEFENAALFTQIRDMNAGLEARVAERTAELTRQERLFRTLAEQAPEVIWNTDDAGRATFLNRAWYELVGGEPAQWLGNGWIERLHPDDRAQVRRNWQHSRETLQPYSEIRRFLAREGTYHTMAYKASPVLDDEGAVAFWVGVDADITELKATEAALRNSNEELEAFSYSVSHDLRAPLGAIGGFSQALAGKLEGNPDERIQHYLTRIRAGVVKMEQLIDALLTLSRVARAPLNYETVDLGSLARETLEGLQMQHPLRRVEAQVRDDLLVQGDVRLLRLVMENLVGNAWKFTGRREEALIEVGRQAGGGAVFVRDNGVGFDMAYSEKLFGAFQRLHSEAEFPGTGVGLATVRRVVSRHQGRIWAESRLDEGTTFFFTLSEEAPGRRHRSTSTYSPSMPSPGSAAPR